MIDLVRWPIEDTLLTFLNRAINSNYRAINRTYRAINFKGTVTQLCTMPGMIARVMAATVDEVCVRFDFFSIERGSWEIICVFLH